MSKNYKQLSLEQRYKIEALLKAGLTQKLVATHIGVHPSTISRELDRNVGKRGRLANTYQANNAQNKTVLRHSIKYKRITFTTKMRDFALDKLCNQRWSPEFISENGKRILGDFVSHERLYQWIWLSKHSNKQESLPYKNLYKYLRHGRRRRKRGILKETRGLIPNRVSIALRPRIVEKRERYGDIEIDLMMGKNHQGALLVMTDRATLHTRLKLLKSKNSKDVRAAIINKLKHIKGKLHTLTFDNDKAFSLHQQIGHALQTDTYFTRPYTSQDKGTVENRIGVIRRFYPKKTDLTLLTDKDVMDVERKINNRPIRKFNYLNANLVLRNKIALIT